MNLTEVVVRSEDTFESLQRKVRLATILGTVQATYTHFPYLREIWRTNTEEERLLGVSLTGIMDSLPLSGVHYGDSSPSSIWGFYETSGCFDLSEILLKLKEEAVVTNKEWAEKLGINSSTAITCVN